MHKIYERIMLARATLLYWSIILPLLALSGLCGSKAMADTPLDYMVQEVCDNGSGGHTNADPITCPTTARKLRIGEALPYHKWDGSTPSSAQQISDSYPIADLQGRFRVVQTTFFDSQTSFVDPVFEASRPSPWLANYDLINGDGTYVSAAGTYDPGRGWQPFWGNSSCSMSDTWIFAPKTATIPFGEGHTTASFKLTSPQCPTVNTFSPALTYWNFYSGYQYESGKALDTIKTWTFYGSTFDNSSGVEEFMFTKQYGKTRWEAWLARSATITGPDAGAVAKCPTGTSAGTVVYGSTTYYLRDCHDWSNVVAAPTGDWDPASKWHVDPQFYSLNVLTNTHMQCTNAGIAQDCTAGGTCQTIAPWQRLGTLNWAYDSALQGSTSTANCALKMSIPNPYTGQESVYQDQNFPSGYSNYTFGTALWLPNGGSAAVTVALFELNASGAIVAQHKIDATLNARPQYIGGSFVKSALATKLRFQIYVETQNVEYEFTESWVAPKP